MTIHIHIGIWWLIVPGIAIYAAGVGVGLAASMVGDQPRWFRMLVLIWPLAALAALAEWLVLFMTGRD
jgi:hypothetical protein